MRGLNYAVLAALAGALSLTAGPARASGYAIREQSGGLMGQAFAGQNAWTADPSVIFFNPAGMSALSGTQVSAAASAIFPQDHFHNDGSTTVLGPLVPLGNNEGGDAGENALVPAFYGMTSYGDLRLGLGVNVPFGLSTSYNDGWIGRFAAVDSELTTVNINPVVSYRINDWLSLGAGAQIEHADARLTNDILLGIGNEGHSELKADDWALGMTAGALFQPLSGTTIGVGWRSSVKHNLNGNAHITSGNGATVFKDGASADLTTPQSVGLSLRQSVSDRIAVSGTVEWTNWSQFDELRVKFHSGTTPDRVTEENWDNTWFYSLGVDYLLLPDLTLRAGVAYDQSPVRTKFRTARLPDNDRTWLAVGATYRVTDAVSFDLGYSHIFVDEAKINETFAVTPTGLTGNLHGHYENSIDIVALQANLRF